MKPRAIANHCRRPGAGLTVVHGRRRREFYLEPAARRVRPQYAIEAIRAGWLIAKDSGLFGDDPQTWVCPPTNTHGEPLARSSPAFHDTSAAETKKMDSRKYYGVSFMKLEDVLTSGPEKKVVYGTEDGKYDKINLIFTDNTALSLNATNWRAVTKALGFETEDWPGAVVEVAAGELKYDGKLNPAILIVSVTPPSGGTPLAGTPPAGKPPIDDDIPF